MKFPSVMINSKLLIFVAIVVFISCSEKLNSDRSLESWKSLIIEHINRYPDMEIKDLYKLVYQGTLGPSHLGTDLNIIKKYLDLELERIESDYSIDLIEKISPSGSFKNILFPSLKVVIIIFFA